MGWDGSGGYTRVHNFSADGSAGIKILASRMDAEINDIASAIPIAWARNGQNVPTTDMPMGGRKFVNVGAPASVSNFMRVREFIENVPIFMQDAETSADRISVSSQYFTSVSANQAPGDGTKIMVRVASNKSSAVMYVDGHSANVEYQDGNRIGAALVSGGIYEFTYSSVDVAWKLPAPSDGRTAAEIAEGVTPANYAYEPGNVLRYGNNTTPGTTDMTAAVQAAIDQAEAGGASVRIPEQTFAVTSLTVDSANGITITGEGYNSVLKGASAGTQIIMLLQRTGYTAMSGVRLSNFRVDGNSGGQLDAGLIQANNCVGFVFDRLWVENGTRVSGVQGVGGIVCSNGFAGGVGPLGSITNCYVRNTSKAGINWTSESVSGYIAGNVVRDCTGNGVTPGIQINGGFNGRVIGNYITGCQGPGILASTDGSNNPSRNTIIANNVVGACGATSTTMADGILIGNASGIRVGRYVITDNQCYDNGNVTGGGAGIHIQTDDNFVLSGNLCRNNRYDGIRVQNCNHVSISGNRCSGNNVAGVSFAGGIHLIGTCAHVAIIGNHCSDDKGSPTQSYGIILETAAVLSYLTIEANHLQGNLTGPLLADTVGKPARISMLAEMQTTDGAAINTQYFTLPDECAVLLSGRALANRSDSSARAIYSREALFYRDAAGAATQQGATTTIGTDIESDATWGGLTLNANSNSIQAQVTGLAATTINWRTQIELTVLN